MFIVTGDQACSWFDYEIIKDVVHRFGDSKAKGCVENYETRFKEYTEQRLPNGLRHIEIGGGAKKGGKHLIVKIDREWEEVTFRDLDKLRGSFATILGIRRRDVYLADVREGCVMMIFVLPIELAQKHLPTRGFLSSSQINSLKNESVILFKYGKLMWRASTLRQAGNTTDGSYYQPTHEVMYGKCLLWVVVLAKNCMPEINITNPVPL